MQYGLLSDEATDIPILISYHIFKSTKTRAEWPLIMRGFNSQTGFNEVEEMMPFHSGLNSVVAAFPYRY
jgi:hypothetical protein